METPNILGIALGPQKSNKRAITSHQQKGQPIADMIRISFIFSNPKIIGVVTGS